MRKLAGHGHDAQLKEFMEHLAIIKGFLEKNMSSGLTDYFEREVDKVSKEVERGRQCEFEFEKLSRNKDPI